VTGIVLAGGRSARMGTAKAFLTLEGRTFLERQVALLRGFCQQIIVAARPGQELPPLSDILLVTDEPPGTGPLAGIAAGLSASSDDWHLVAACDLPLALPSVVRLLSEQAGDADAVVPEVGGRLQPLLAAYARACLEPAREALRAGQRRVAAMLDRVRVQVVPEDQVRQVDPGLVSFVNVNTWQDYQALVAGGSQEAALRQAQPRPSSGTQRHPEHSRGATGVGRRCRREGAAE